ncbi:MAG: hypothetical protein O3A36_01660 [bacterium]|nr:hypothetical protein [bacterium]
MASVTIPKTEYQRLEREAKAYRKFAERFFESVLEDSVPSIMRDFKETGLYSEEFLLDLENGLKKSAHVKK